MNIGPMISPPPLVPFLKALGSAMNAVGVTRGRSMLLPTGFVEGGRIDYNPVDSSYYTDMAKGGTGWIREHYRYLGGDAARSSFLEEVDLIDGIMRMSTRDVVRAVGGGALFRGAAPADLDRMIQRLDSLGGRTIAELGSMATNNKTLMSLAGGLKVFEAAGNDVDLIARRGYGVQSLNNPEAASFYFIAGVLHSLSSAPDAVELANDSFMHSSLHFAKGGLDVAAALAAEYSIAFMAEMLVRMTSDEVRSRSDGADKETASYIEALLDDISMASIDPALLHLEAIETAARHWKDVAEKNIDVRADEAAAMIAIQRGMLAAIVHWGEQEVYDMRRRFHFLASMLNRRHRRFEDVAHDHLRMAFTEIDSFDGSAGAWSTMADSIYKAVHSFEKAGNMDAVRKLKLIEAFAWKQEGAIRKYLPQLDEDVLNADNNPTVLRRRAFFKLSHGNLGGALDDIRRASDLSPGNAGLLSDEALIHHHFSHYLRFLGDDSQSLQALHEAANLLKEASMLLKNIPNIDEWRDRQRALVGARVGAAYVSMDRLKEALGELETAHFLSVGSELEEEIHSYLMAVRRLRTLH